MSRPNEFQRPAIKSLSELTPQSCNVEGADAPELFDPMAEYARAHLVNELDTFTGFDSQRINFYRGGSQPDYPTGRDGLVTHIVIAPKTGVGHVSVSQFEIWRGKSVWGASIVYCVHIVIENGTKTIVIERFANSIG